MEVLQLAELVLSQSLELLQILHQLQLLQPFALAMSVDLQLRLQPHHLWRQELQRLVLTPQLLMALLFRSVTTTPHIPGLELPQQVEVFQLAELVLSP